MKKLIVGTLLVVLSLSELSAQQDAMFTHYMYNTLAVNPAYAGSRNALTLTGLHRSQWVGFDGAPTTQTFTMHTPIIKENIGIGLSILNDKIGPSNSTSIFADFAYHIKVSEKAKLSLGLKGGGSLRGIELTPLETTQSNDNAFLSNQNTSFLPNFGFGLYYYLPKFYAGLSAPNLIQNDITSGNGTLKTNLINEQRHYFAILGTVFDLSENLELKPTALVKVTEGAPIEGDITATFILKQMLHLGAMYRTGDAAGVLLGYNISDQFYAGYSFDWSFLNSTGKYNSGSHEIMLRYDFLFNKQKKIKSPRYF